MNNVFFKPDPERVWAFDALMRQRLAESLEYLRGQLGDRVELDDEEFSAALERIREHPCLPDTYGKYYIAVMAAAMGNLDDCVENLNGIISDESADGSIALFAFSDPEHHARSQFYLDFFDSSPDSKFPILPLEDAEFTRASALVEDALALLSKGEPELAAEIRALLRVIMFGAGPNKKGEYTFDGASSFELWGSIALNGLRAKNRVDMAEILAHESCHVLLFGFCIDGDLVLNPDDDRHPSPLRDDPRPVDGIFHATFVLARMYHSLRVLEMSGELTEAEQVDINQRKKKRIEAFYDGLSVLREHAKYTAEGEALIEACSAYMDTHAKPSVSG